MASRKLDDLHLIVKNKAVMMVERCSLVGVTFLITCTFRSLEEQEALYAQGRKPLEEVNSLRLSVRLPSITIIENKKKITNARPGSSLHNYRLAFDIVPLEAGKLIWDNKNVAWLRAGAIGKECGLEWAGDWKTFKEYPHFQYTGGLTLKEIQEGKIPE